MIVEIIILRSKHGRLNMLGPELLQPDLDASSS